MSRDEASEIGELQNRRRGNPAVVVALHKAKLCLADIRFLSSYKGL
jgi:hypothetical protein